jgi:hypothetical protein
VLIAYMALLLTNLLQVTLHGCLLEQQFHLLIYSFAPAPLQLQQETMKGPTVIANTKKQTELDKQLEFTRCVRTVLNDLLVSYQWSLIAATDASVLGSRCFLVGIHSCSLSSVLTSLLSICVCTGCGHHRKNKARQIAQAERHVDLAKKAVQAGGWK